MCSFLLADPTTLSAVEFLLTSQLKAAFSALDCVLPSFVDRAFVFTSNIVNGVPESYTGDTAPLNELKADNALGLRTLSANIHVNALTKIPHTERDISYTLITVPKQPDGDNMGINFQFILSKHKSLFVRMNPAATFAYSALFMTHRQNHDYGTNCLNVSSYGNQRLFFCSRTSLDRINQRSRR